MSELVFVGTMDEIPPGESKIVVHEEVVILVLNVDGDYFAVDKMCPHASGPLDEGFIEKGRIICPWHAWSFPLSPEDAPNDGLSRYRVVVEGDNISIEYPEIEADRGWK